MGTGHQQYDISVLKKVQENMARMANGVKAKDTKVKVKVTMEPKDIKAIGHQAKLSEKKDSITGARTITRLHGEMKRTTSTTTKIGTTGTEI